MKLKEFNSENTVNVRGGGKLIPAIGINLKVGLFNISKAACELIDLKNNDQVVIHQDQEDKGNWYIEKVKAKGFIVRNKEAITSGVLFNNTTLARAIGESVDFKGKSGKALIAGQPTMQDKRKLWGLILSGFTN